MCVHLTGHFGEKWRTRIRNCCGDSTTSLLARKTHYYRGVGRMLPRLSTEHAFRHGHHARADLSTRRGQMDAETRRNSTPLIVRWHSFTPTPIAIPASSPLSPSWRPRVARADERGDAAARLGDGGRKGRDLPTAGSPAVDAVPAAAHSGASPGRAAGSPRRSRARSHRRDQGIRALATFTTAARSMPATAADQETLLIGLALGGQFVRNSTRRWQHSTVPAGVPRPIAISRNIGAFREPTATLP